MANIFYRCFLFNNFKRSTKSRGSATHGYMTRSGVNESRLSKGHKESGKRLDLICHIVRTLCLCWSYSDIGCKMPASIDSGIYLSAPVSIESSLSALLTPRR